MWGTTSVWPQEGDEIQHRAVSVGLGFRGSARPLLAVGPWVLHPQGCCVGWPSGCCRTPCPAVPWAGSTWSLLLGISSSSRLQGRREQAVCLLGAVVVLPSLPSSPPLPVQWRLLLSSLLVWGGRVTSDTICPFPIAGLALGHGEVGERLYPLCNSLLLPWVGSPVSCLCHRAGNTRAVFADRVSCSGLSLGLPWCCCHSSRPAGAM